jgi:phosphatidyl-myo-inositol dimannoside synthase
VRNILALVTDAYGGTGGIALYNRDVLAALAEDPETAKITCLPRVISAPLEPVPDKVFFDPAAAGGLSSYFGALWRVLRSGVKFDLIYCAHVNLIPVARLLSMLLGVRWVLCLYGVEAWQPIPRLWPRRGARTADAVFSISKVTLDRFRSWCPVEEKRCHLIPNAIDASQFAILPKDPDLLSRFGLKGRPAIMTLGRLDPLERAKGFDHVIGVLPELRQTIPDLAYLIVGSGGDKGRLEALAASLGVAEAVIFAGFVSEADKPRYYALADAYVMPSRMEGFGFVFLEALACGLPVVASSTDGGREAVREGKFGRIVDPEDPAALAEAVLWALKQPRQIPNGLDYFSFANFSIRMRAAVHAVIAAR